MVDDSWDVSATENVIAGKFLHSLTIKPPAFEAMPAFLAEATAAFYANLASVSAAASLPVTLSTANLLERNFNRVLVAKHIRSGVHVPPRNVEERAIIRKNTEEARKELEASVESKEGRQAVFADVALDLATAMAAEDNVTVAANELLFQTLTSTWTAFEILGRDLTLAWLNMYPTEALRLLQNESTKKRFEQKFSIGELIEVDFNLNKIGNLLLRDRADFSDYFSIKAVLDVLLSPCSSLQTRETNDALLLLNRKRNLIVHRRGIVDVRFKAATGSKLELGSRLILSADEVAEYVITTAKAGGEIVEQFIERSTLAPSL